MFKSKEELLKKEDEFFDDLCSGYNTGILVAFKSFSERIDCYYEHKQHYETDFCNRNTGLYNKFVESKFKHWDDFLFDYYFGDLR